MPPEKVIYRFGAFELDTARRQLRKAGVRLRFGGQPFEVLQLLLEAGNEVVRRDQLRDRLWPGGVHVDFEHNLNKAVNKLREVLGDSAGAPRYIETLPRVGYRFTAPIERCEPPSPVPAEIAVAPAPPRTTGRPALWLSLAALACVLGALFFLIIQGAGGQKLPAYSAVPITAFPGRETSPSFSPDGNQVAFVWDGSGADNIDIYRIRIGEAHPARLTFSPARDYSPAWSPDGSSIAFLRDLDARTAGVFLVPAQGGNARQIAAIASPPEGYAAFGIPRRALTWSADSQWVVAPEAASPGGPLGLVAVSVRDGSRRPVAAPPAAGLGFAAPAISRDGKWIAFLDGGFAHSAVGIRVGRLDASLRVQGEARSVALPQPFVDTVAWSFPEGRLLAALSPSLDGARALQELDAGGGVASPIAGLGGDIVEPDISSAARRLAFARRDIRRCSIWRFDIGGQAPAAQITTSTSSNMDADISPDGRRLAFRSLRSGQPAIWIAGADGGDTRQLADIGAEGYGNPRWSPDGRWIAFHARTHGNSDIWAVSVETGEKKRLSYEASSEAYPTWSRDGRFVYYSSNAGSRPQIWRAPVEGGAAQEVRNGQGRYAAEAADGRDLYIADDQRQPGLVRLSPLTGVRKTILPAIASPSGFAVTSQGVYYLAPPTPDGRSEIRFLDFANNRSHSILSLSRPAESGLSITAGARTLVFSQVDWEDSSLMLVEHFR